MTTIHAVRHTPVSFEVAGDRLAGVLYVPAHARGPSPGCVVAGSWTTVKQQMAGLYAQRMAERGYVTLAFDFRGFGASDGTPRDIESPARKADDMAAAAAFLASTSEVDGDRVAALAVCASGGYTAVAVAGGAPISSLGLVAPWLHDGALVGEIYGGKQGVRARIEAGDDARRRYEETGHVEYVMAVSDEDESAAMFGPFEYYLDENRGRVPEWPDRFAVMAWRDWLTFDAISAAPGVDVPTVIVHSVDAALPDGARRFAAGLPDCRGVEWIGGTQFDFYDQEPNVSRAVDICADHFATTAHTT